MVVLFFVLSICLVVFSTVGYILIEGLAIDFHWYPCTYKMSKDKRIIKVKWWLLSHKLGKTETFYRPDRTWLNKNGIDCDRFVDSLLEPSRKEARLKEERSAGKEEIKKFLDSRKQGRDQ